MDHPIEEHAEPAADAGAALSAVYLSDSPLVGREAQLADVGDALSRAGSGMVTAVLLEGEAGIGKSRILEEALRTAARQGFRVFLGRSEELESSRPFGALSDALAIRPRSDDPARAAIARLLYPDGTDERALPGAGAQFQVVESLVDLVERTAASGPVALAIEDMHWADPSTVLAFRTLHRALGHVPVALVATLRPAPRSTELAAMIDRVLDEGALHLRLGPLAAPDVHGIAEQSLGAPPGQRLRQLLGGAAGNPLFVTELLKALVQEGSVDVRQGEAEVERATLPPTLRLTVLRRLSFLPAPSIELLRLASILGSTFSMGDLSVIAGRPALELLPAVEEAMRAGLIVEAGPSLAFRHDLLREAVYQDMPEAVRAALHRDAGRALAGAGVPAGRVATHLALGASPGDAEAVAWLRRAAGEAAPRSPAIAADLLQRAAALLQPGDPERDAVAAELVDQLLWSGRVHEAHANASAILAGPHDAAVSAPLRISLGRALNILGRPREAVDVASDEGMTPVGHDPERILMASDRSFAWMLAGDLERAEAEAADLVAEVGRSGFAVVAYSALAHVATFRGDLDEAERRGREVLELVRETRDPSLSRFPSHYVLALTLLYMDRLEDAGELISDGRRIADEHGNVATLPLLEWASAVRLFLAGGWDDATAAAEGGLVLAGDYGLAQGASYAQSLLAVVAVHRGEVSEAERHLDQAERHPDVVYFAEWPAWGRAELLAAVGDTERALEWAVEAWRRAERAGLAVEIPFLGPGLVRLARAQGRDDRAREAADAVEDVAARMGSPSALAAALLVRGLVDEDQAVLQAAVEAHANSPRVFERARALEDVGTFLVSRRDTDGAIALLRDSLEAYESVGARLDVARVAAELRGLGVRRGSRGARGRPASGWGALTGTELQVAKLVAEGLTNREIGERLFVSPRTVETHVSHMFSKLGFSSRAELVAEATRRRL